MEATRNREPLDCPFCVFCSHDHYELLFHVETVHPESTPPSLGPHEQASEDPCGEEAGTKDSIPEDSPVKDPDFIECQCGEFCLVAEFESHLEMHYAESMNFDEVQSSPSNPAVQESTLHHGKASSTNVEIPLASPSKAAVSKSQDFASRRTPAHRTSQSDGRKSQGLVQDFIDVLRYSTAPPSRRTSRSKSRKAAQRLGRKELGPHAHEERMPEWLRKQLELGAKVTMFNHISLDGRLVQVETIANEFHGIIPVLAQLCEQDSALSRVYLCHPSVTHVVKMAKEGGFCGYRNIQMLISYIRDSRSTGHERFPGRLPSIIRLQDLIEGAWDRGFNPIGRIETGGIRGTRKYIGTPEAQALLQSLNIGCKADGFSTGNHTSIQQQLLDAVEQYFVGGHSNSSPKICRTSLPPVYFQHPGHSLTIVGLEVRRNGSRNLLVFDPMFKPSPGIYRLIGTQFRAGNPEKLLKAYRRGEAYLKYTSYETLQLTYEATPKAGWHGS